MNICRYALCPTPLEPLSLAKRRYHPWCAVQVQRASWRDRSRVDPSKPMRAYDNSRRQALQDMDSPEAMAAVEQAFQQALAEIKRRPRGEPDLRWSSPLHGLKGTGL